MNDPISTEVARLLITSSPMALVVLLLGNQIIAVAREYLAEGRRQRLAIIFRLKKIEDKLGIVFDPDETQKLP